MARPLDCRVRVLAAANLGAHTALSDRRSRGSCRRAGNRKLYRRTLAQPAPAVARSSCAVSFQPARRRSDQRQPRRRFATDAVQRFGFDVVRGSSSKMGASALIQLGRVLSRGRRHCRYSRRPARSGLRTWPRNHFSCPENRRGAASVQPGIFKLLAVEKLGPFHSAPAIFARSRHCGPAPPRRGNRRPPKDSRPRDCRFQTAMMSLVERR